MDKGLSASPRIGVAFGGGGARGIAHIHIVDVLDEMGLKPSIIAGSSIGSIIGTGVANGMSGQDIRDYMREVFTQRAEIARRIWRTRPEHWGELLKGGFRLSQFNIEKILAVFLPPDVPGNIEDLQIPLIITASDFHAAKEITIESGDLRSAIAASCAIPPVFAPVWRNGRIMVDGGLFNPVPFDLLMGKADIVIGVDVIGTPSGPDDYMPTTFEALMVGSQLTMCSIIENKFRLCAPDIFLRPDIGGIGLLDFMKFEQILTQSAGVRDELKRALDAALTSGPAVPS